MSEWIIVAVVGVILLFSAKKLPDMARGLGQSMRIFKAETRGMREDDQKATPASPGTTASTASTPSTPSTASIEQPAPGQSAPGRTAGDGTTSGTTAPGVSPESQSGGSSAS